MTNHVEASTLTDHLIVCGLGHVGYRIFSLLKRLGENVIVITGEAGDVGRLTAETPFPIIAGDARDEELLRQAGVERAKAILVVTSDDLANVSIALDARRLNPKIIIVVRLFDQSLAAHLEKSIRINRALSATALAAPAFAAAALGETVWGAFEAGGATFVLEDRVVEGGPLSIGEVSQEWDRRFEHGVIALRRGEITWLRPETTTKTQAGDRLTCLRYAKDDRKKVHPSRQAKKNRTGFSALRTMIFGIREWWRDVPGALRIAMTALFTVVALSVVIFHLQLGLPWVDAIYFVIATVATVGYGDYNLMSAPPWMKLVGSFVILCGAAIFAILFSLITDLIVGTRFRDVLARGCARYQGHIIVAGLGEIGFRLVRELVHDQETVVAIELRENGEFVQPTREIASVVLGNAKMEETLRKAGVAGAKTLIAATDDDLANLSIGLATKRAHDHCRVVVRLFDAELADKLHQSMAIESILSVSAAAAPTFVGSVYCPDVVQGVVLRDYLVLILHRTVKPDSSSTGMGEAQTCGQEHALFVKRAGEVGYRTACPGTLPQAGDQIIGVQWLPFPSTPGNS